MTKSKTDICKGSQKWKRWHIWILDVLKEQESIQHLRGNVGQNRKEVSEIDHKSEKDDIYDGETSIQIPAYKIHVGIMSVEDVWYKLEGMLITPTRNPDRLHININIINHYIENKYWQSKAFSFYLLHSHVKMRLEDAILRRQTYLNYWVQKEMAGIMKICKEVMPR